MKTEGLTLVEAWQALLDGHVVKDTPGEHQGAFWYKVSNGKFYEYGHLTPEWTEGEGRFLHQSFAPFSIVPDPSIPEPKSLSFDEAVEVLKRGGEIHVKSDKDPQKWFFHSETIGSLNFLDLAERKGWPITERTP